MEFLCGFSARARIESFAASGAAGNRAAGGDDAGDSLVGAESDFGGAGNYFGGGFAGRLDGAERRGEIFNWGKTDGGGAGGSEFAGAADAAKRNELKEITVRAESAGKAIGAVKLRVELRKRALPQ